MSKSSKFNNGVSRRTLLKGATGALGLAAGILYDPPAAL